MEIAHISKGLGIIEAVIKENGKTTFAVFKDGKIEFKDKITLPNGESLVPLSATSDAIKHGFITLPPEPIEYESELSLLKEIKIFIAKYFYIGKGFCETSALYIMLSWVFERFNELPYMRVIGTFGTGKSRYLRVMGAIAFNPISVGSSSVAAMFRTISQFGGTFILDEADFKSSEFSSDVAKILNNGHSKGAPVARMREKANSKGEFSVDLFQVFGPKILASRETFNDTALESRCFAQRLYPNTNINAPISLDNKFFEEAKILRGKLLTFRFRNFSKIKIKELGPEKIPNLRIRQIAQPIWNIALLIGPKTAGRAVNEASLMNDNLISDQADT